MYQNDNTRLEKAAKFPEDTTQAAVHHRVQLQNTFGNIPTRFQSPPFPAAIAAYISATP